MNGQVSPECALRKAVARYAALVDVAGVEHSYNRCSVGRYLNGGIFSSVGTTFAQDAGFFRKGMTDPKQAEAGLNDAYGSALKAARGFFDSLEASGEHGKVRAARIELLRPLEALHQDAKEHIAYNMAIAGIPAC